MNFETDADATAAALASVAFLAGARAGTITEPVETITEGDMVNPDYMPTADIDAYWEDQQEQWEARDDDLYWSGTGERMDDDSYIDYLNQN